MDNYARLYETMGKAFSAKAMPLIVGKVVSIEDDTCTVDFGDNNILSGVRLKVQIGGESDRLILFPATGKMVLCGSLTGDLTDLVMLKSERIEKLLYVENGVTVEIDSNTGKLKVQSGNISLKELFDDLKSIIQNLKVFTPSGPSGTPLPATIANLNTLQTKINTLLS